jgi:hypothetical protein
MTAEGQLLIFESANARLRQEGVAIPSQLRRGGLHAESREARIIPPRGVDENRGDDLILLDLQTRGIILKG